MSHVALLPDEFLQVCGEEGSGRSELSTKLPFRPHPEVFHILRVDVRVDWVNKILLVNYNIVLVHTSVQLTNVVVCSPAVGHDVCARKAPLSYQRLQCRCRSIAYHSHTAQPTFPLDGHEHPHTVHKPSTVVLSVEKVRFVDFDNNWVSIVVETAKLNGIPPDVSGAYIPDEVRPVDGRLPRNRQVPLHVVHGHFLCPTKQEPHKLPQSNLALEEGVYSEAFSPMTLSAFPAVAVLRISLCHQATRNRTLRACVRIVEQPPSSHPLHYQLDVAFQHQFKLEWPQSLKSHRRCSHYRVRWHNPCRSCWSSRHCSNCSS